MSYGRNLPEEKRDGIKEAGMALGEKTVVSVNPNHIRDILRRGALSESRHDHLCFIGTATLFWFLLTSHRRNPILLTMVVPGSVDEDSDGTVPSLAEFLSCTYACNSFQ